MNIYEEGGREGGGGGGVEKFSRMNRFVSWNGKSRGEVATRSRHGEHGGMSKRVGGYPGKFFRSRFKSSSVPLFMRELLAALPFNTVKDFGGQNRFQVANRVE